MRLRLILFIPLSIPLLLGACAGPALPGATAPTSPLSASAPAAPRPSVADVLASPDPLADGEDADPDVPVRSPDGGQAPSPHQGHGHHGGHQHGGPAPTDGAPHQE